MKSIIFKRKTKTLDVDQFINSFVQKIKSPVRIIKSELSDKQPQIWLYYKIYYKFE